MSMSEDFEQRVRDALKRSGQDGLSVDELRYQLGEDVDRDALRRLLSKWTRAGKAVRLARDYFALPTVQSDVVGRLRYQTGQYVVEGPDQRYTISPENLGDAIAGDVVRVVPTGEESRGRQRAIIVETVRKAPREVFAVMRKSGRWIVASAPAIDEPILVVDELARPGGGELRISGRAARRRRVVAGLPLCPLLGEIVRSSKNVDAPDDELEFTKMKAREAFRFVRRGERNADVLLDQLARGLQIDVGFQTDALAEAGRVPDEVTLRDSDVDLRDEALCTIDGETAKDFDDAVYANKLESGDIELLVAIADVSHYVRYDSALDLSARERGSSVYLPGRVYPMLPERLSNGLCSLVPDEDRYCTWVRMRIAPGGDITWYDLGFGVMRSHARLTYTRVQAHFDGERVEETPIAASLDALYEVYRRLNKRRKSRGMLDFSLPEAKIELTEDKSGVAGVASEPRWDSNRLIEECMLATNETVADFLTREGWPCIFRSHDEPNEEKLDQAWAFVSRLIPNLRERGGRRSIDDIMALVAALTGHSAERVANFVILRSMKRASYAIETEGHFGIGASRYAHFTSPIRRYADLEVHRVLREALQVERPAPGQVRRLKTRLLASAQAANEGETIADNAERLADRLMKALYMSNRVGEVFDATVTGVQNFGMFVSASEDEIEGLVHISAFPGRERYVVNDTQDELRGLKTGRRFRLGQRIRVRCVGVAIHEGQIDFEVVSQNEDVVPNDEREVVDGEW